MGELRHAAVTVTLALCTTLTACGGEPAATSAKPAAPDHTYVAPTNVVPTLAHPTPKPSDFTLRLKTLSKQCFGNAGCNITYRVQASWSASLDPAQTYEVSYEVRGAEDGPILGTIDVTGDQYETEDENMAGTTGKGKKLSVVVTGVEGVG